MKSAYFTHVWGRPGITPAQRYTELWNEVATADRLGYDYAFSVEHHCTPRESWMTAPVAFGTGVAARTENIRFGPFGWVPPLRHPLHLVEDVATLDQLSSGRLEVGLASGVSKEPFEPFGADYENRKSLTTEAAEFLISALSGDGTLDFKGEHHTIRDAELTFGAVQKPHPPIWIPSNNRHMLRKLAGLGAHTGSTMIVPRAATAAPYGHYAKWFREQHGTTPNIGYWTLVHVADTDAQAEARAAEHIKTCFTETLSYTSINRSAPQAAPPSELSTRDILTNSGDLGFLLERNLIFVGSPATVAERIRKAAEEGHWNVVLGEFTFGDLGMDLELESMELYAEQVVPQIADLDPVAPKPTPVPATTSASGYDTADEARVAARLEALGYIE